MKKFVSPSSRYGKEVTPTKESQVRTPNLTEALSEKENTNLKLESSISTFKKYSMMKRELETNITDLKAKEQISVGILDNKISFLIQERNKLEECDDNMPEEQFLIAQIRILKKHFKEHQDRMLNIKILKENGLIDEGNSAADFIENVDRITKEVKKAKKREKAIYHAFDEDQSEETLKRRIMLLTNAGEQEMRQAESAKSALQESVNELQAEINKIKEKNKRIRASRISRSTYLFQSPIDA